MRTPKKSSPEYDRPSQTAARNLRMILTGERWTGRKAALAIGVNHMYVTRRLNGDVPLTIADIVAFAKLLKMEPAELTAKLCSPEA